MKSASANLVNLFASSNQFVMWEEFTFTLANGSTLTYSTIDPDNIPAIVAPPPPPPPPPPATYVLDTFTGTGNLSTHVGEDGATWSFVSGSDSLDDCQLSGGGSMTEVGPNNITIAPSGNIINDTSDFYIELKVQMDANEGTVQQVFVFQFSSDFSYSVGFVSFNPATDANAVVSFSLQTPMDGSVDSGNLDSMVARGNEMTISVVVDQTRERIRGYVNGVLLATLGASEAIITDGQIQFGLDSGGGGFSTLNINQIEAASL